MVSFSTCLVALAVGMPSDVEVVKFTAEWCGPCQAMQPVMDQLARQGVSIQEIDIDKRPGIAKQHGVTTVPTLFLVSRGKIVDRIVGATSLQDLKTRIARVSAARPTERPSNASRSATTPTATRSRSRGHRPSNGRDSSQRVSAPGRPDDTERIARAATVRLKVDDEYGHSYGSGTIVHVHGRDALILTCGHVFRDSRGKGEITVDLFATQQPQSVKGQLIRYDLDRDLALVGIRTDIELHPVKVAGKSFHVAPGQRLFSLGCDQGRDPTVLRGKLRAVNKYLGPENLVVSGQPIDGRSGGGLFSYDGKLVGVCNAADPEYDEGLYAAFASVHRHLDEAKLGFVYDNGREASPQLADARSRRREPRRQAQPVVANGEPPRIAPPRRPGRPSVASVLDGRPQDDRLAASRSNRNARSRTNHPPASRPSGLAGGRTETLPDDAEIICIIRRNGQPRSQAEVVVLDRPSRQFLAQLNEEQSEQHNRQMTDLRVRQRRTRE